MHHPAPQAAKTNSALERELDDALGNRGSSAPWVIHHVTPFSPILFGLRFSFFFCLHFNSHLIFVRRMRVAQPAQAAVAEGAGRVIAVANAEDPDTHTALAAKLQDAAALRSDITRLEQQLLTRDERARRWTLGEVSRAPLSSQWHTRTHTHTWQSEDVGCCAWFGLLRQQSSRWQQQLASIVPCGARGGVWIILGAGIPLGRFSFLRRYHLINEPLLAGGDCGFPDPAIGREAASAAGRA